MSTTSKPKFTHVPQHVLRRLAGRALKVLARHDRDHAAVQMLADPFVPTARAFIDAYDRAQGLGTSRSEALPRARAAVETLRSKVQAWAPLLRRDRVHCHLGAFTIAAATPSEMLADGSRLVADLSERLERHPTGPSYLPTCVREITDALREARERWRQGQDLTTQHLESLRTLRPLATEVQQQLVALRRTLKAALGRNHPDHQKVRLDRALRYDEEDIEVLTGSAVAGDPVASVQKPRRQAHSAPVRPLPSRRPEPECNWQVG